MRRLCLGFLRVYSSCRHLADKGIYKESDTRQNKRDAENLSHVQSHRLLESHLRFLDEFYQEAHAKKHYEENTDECAAIYLVKLEPVHPEEDEAENQIAEGLIQLCRVFRLSLTAKFEDKAPRQVGHVSVNL